MKLVKLVKTGLLGSLALVAGTAMAQSSGINIITGTILGQTGGIVDLLSAISYIAGVGFGIKAALKFKEHNESKGQIPISQPITLFAVAAMLLALPTILQIAKEALFGTGSTGTDSDGGNMRSVR